MPSGLAPRTDLKLSRSPSARQQAQRRLTVIFAVVALALGAGIIGSLTRSAPATPAFGPFSYFPTQ
jgi:hypothetical protein